MRFSQCIWLKDGRFDESFWNIIDYGCPKRWCQTCSSTDIEAQKEAGTDEDDKCESSGGDVVSNM